MIAPVVRFLFAAVLFLASLWVVLPATSVFLWHLVILVTEFGHWLCGFVLLVLLWEWRAKPNPLKIYTLGFSVPTLFLFLLPLFQADRIAQTLPQQLAAAFGPAGTRVQVPASPLSAGTLWSFPLADSIHEVTLQNDHRTAPQGAIEFYHDDRKEPEPCLLMVHGGGWNSGDEKQLGSFNRALARSGLRVASVAYRLAPAYRWPAQKEDVLSGFAYLQAHAGELGIDPGHFIFFGRSAGGQIALDCAYAAHDPAIQGCISLYAPTDMFFAYATGRENDILHSRALVRDFMGGTPDQQAAAYADASPLKLVSAQSPPTLLIHGTRDELVWVRHAQRLRDRLAQLGRPVYFLELPWATHAYDFNPRGPGGQLTLYAMAVFINAVTSSSPPAGR